MPVVYRIDGTQKIIYTSCTGEVKMNEIVDHFRELVHDPACPERLNVLLDLTAAKNFPTTDQLERISDEIGKSRARVQFDACAIVAPTDLMFGLMRMFEVFTEGKFIKTRTFRDVSKAQRWLTDDMTHP